MDTTVTVTVTDTVTDTVADTVLEEEDFLKFLEEKNITKEQYKNLTEVEKEQLSENYVLRR